MSDEKQNIGKSTEPAPPPSQPMRWLKYGTNVAVLVIATAAIVVMINWIGYTQYYTRLDFTETRQYSLSQQTEQLLDQLDTELSITTLYADGTEEPEFFRRVQDLLEEYARRSGSVRVDQIDPTLERERFVAFTRDLTDRFADETRASRDAVEQGTAAFEQIRQFTQQQRDQLNDLLPLLNQQTQDLVLLVRQLDEVFMRMEDELIEYEEGVEQALAEDLPDYAEARRLARQPLREFKISVLDEALERFDQSLNDPAVPGAVEDALLGMQEDYEQLSDRLGDVTGQLEDVESTGYDRFRESLLQTNSLVVAMDAEQARHREDRGLLVLTLDEIYPNLILSRMSQGEVRPEQGYKGEEVLSGAIMSLTVEHDTRVVFVNPRRQPVLGEGRSSYRLVAQRLRQMNFEVEEWQPIGGVGPDGQPREPEPAPTPEEGERMVYIGLPASSDPRMGGGYDSPAVRAVLDHLDSGHPTLLVLSAKPPTDVGETNPIEQWLAEHGIVVDPTRVAIRHTAAAGGRVRGITQVPLAEWPDEHVISRAASGLRGVLLQGVYLSLDEDAADDLQLAPLVEAPADAWAGKDYFEPQRAKPGDEDPRGPFPVAAAMEQDDDRVVVFGDPAFATDAVLQHGPQNVFGQVMFSQFPANQELFVNSVYWLAGMDDLIAPGARTQDVRRIAAISNHQMQIIGWGVLVGLPMLCLLAGVGVWFVRRQ